MFTITTKLWATYETLRLESDTHSPSLLPLIHVQSDFIPLSGCLWRSSGQANPTGATWEGLNKFQLLHLRFFSSCHAATVYKISASFYGSDFVGFDGFVALSVGCFTKVLHSYTAKFSLSHNVTQFQNTTSTSKPRLFNLLQSVSHEFKLIRVKNKDQTSFCCFFNDERDETTWLQLIKYVR